MPVYKRIRSGRLYEQIVEQIEERILKGGLKPGDRFPPEHELAKQFEVSRTAVREAMKVLSHKGLAESHPGRGTFVTDGTAGAVRHSLDLLVKIEERDGIENLVEVREILEPEIAALAALRRQEGHLEAMRKAVSVMATTGHAALYNQVDLDFHRTLAQAAGNTLIQALFESIIDPLRRQMRLTFSLRGEARLFREQHKRILEAIERRDPQAARQAMVAHLKQICKTGQAIKPSGD